MSNKYISTTEYANKHGVSKMQVIRLIRAGKITAQRVGKSWMISDEINNINQENLEKFASLQKWNKYINSKLKKNLRIEKSKDREIIYAKLHSLGLPHERCVAFQIGRFPTKSDFEIAVGRIGMPFWISAVPDPKHSHLNRLSKLDIRNEKSGISFVNRLPEKEKYKIIISQYPKKPIFKGTLLISPTGCGIAEFIEGDRHYLMSIGLTLTDPMLFDKNSIKRYSKTITKAKQDKIFNLVRGVYGYLEVQYGEIDGKNGITFFDYNEEEAYTEIDDIWADLVGYFKKKRTKEKDVLYGLPASVGKAKGKCLVVHHENIGIISNSKDWDILVSDTTTSDMTAFMAKAKAIVTDLGGVTSHAAIVCRELKIPAIVGVKNATEKLRTGDVVEVNADKGQIKIQ